ncbi:MAG: hypothetical protein ACR2NH_10515 [Solirubrobacteraceae bacterium]
MPTNAISRLVLVPAAPATPAPSAPARRYRLARVDPAPPTERVAYLKHAHD